MGELHLLAKRQALRGRLGHGAWLAVAALTLSWPLRLVWRAWLRWRRHAPTVTERHGITPARQYLDLLRLGLRYGLPPLCYYRFRLFLPENRARMHQYVFDHEVASLFPYLNGYPSDSAIHNKRLFAARCAAAGLPVAPVLGWGAGGQWHWTVGRRPAGNLFSKPAVGSKGQGGRLWYASGAGRYREQAGNPDALALTMQELTATLLASSGGREWLLQPALENHAELAGLSPGPLVCVRLMTALRANGQCEPFLALLKMPLGRASTNNLGLGSSIDLEQGRLGRAYSYQPLHDGLDHHPDTDAPITARQLPCWPQTLELATVAHRLFPDLPLLGWDIAITADGPVLLEANIEWDTILPQVAAGRPLGETRFAALCGELLGPG